MRNYTCIGTINVDKDTLSPVYIHLPDQLTEYQCEVLIEHAKRKLIEKNKQTTQEYLTETLSSHDMPETKKAELQQILTKKELLSLFEQSASRDINVH